MKVNSLKNILYPAVIIIFFAFTFQSSPPGWYQQTLPVNDLINDIFFIDSLTGWAVTNGSRITADTAYILKTTNGGNNWNVQLTHIDNIQSVQFLNYDTGFAVGGRGFAEFFKTTNGGLNWDSSKPFGTDVAVLNNLSFVNALTGWITGNDAFGGGVFKTINGGNNWTRQTNPDTRPASIFMLTQDTGWFGGDNAASFSNLYRTTNGGINWNVQFVSAYTITSIFFLNSQKGWIRGGTTGSSGVAYTTNGGFNWTNGQGGEPAAGYDVKFINDSIGYSGGEFGKIPKSTDGGKTWGYQIMPIFTSLQIAVLRGDTSRVWAGRTGIAHTTDGGGVIVSINNEQTAVNNDYKLFQNYPNPFNPSTNIGFRISNFGFVMLTVYDINGKLIEILIEKNLSAGAYEVEFNSNNNLTSGIYFYSLLVNNYKETKKMILVK